MSSTPASHTPDEPLSPADSNDGEDLGTPQTSVFLRHVSETARQSHCASLDHLYSRPWGWRSDGAAARQARLLLVQPLASSDRQAGGANIDVETVDEPVNLTEPDEAAAQAAMDECQEHVTAARDVPDDLIDQLDQSSWSPARRQLLRQVLSALNGYQLARRAVQGRRGAAFVARMHADRCAARVRRALAAIGWQRQLCHWLHTLLLQKLGKDLLAIYLEVLQTLTSKVPSLVSRLTAIPGGARHGPLAAETLAPLLRRPWDPAAHLINQHKMERLPNNPLLVLVPSSPCHGSEAGQLGFGTNRVDFWQRQLSALGKVVPISVFEGGAPVRGISVSESLSHILAMCRQQIGELRRPGRPLVLLGWGAAGLVAAHLALVEPVSAVVALGLPCWSPAGRRGEPDDPLLELRTPTLLVVGQTATDAAPHQLELLRDRMRAETGLLVVGGADSRLLVTGSKKQREALTQSMVDRAIMEEISEFLSGILAEQLDGRRPLFPRLPSPPPPREDAVLKNLARERRRKSTTLPAPPAKRQPDKLAKAAARGQRGRPRPTPPPPESTPTPTPSATDCDDSTSEPPIIDLIQDVDAETSEAAPEQEPEPTPKPEPTLVAAASRAPAAAPPPSPAATSAPAAPHASLKVLTTPPFRPQGTSVFAGQPSGPSGRPFSSAARPLQQFGGGRLTRGARQTRGGRLKITHKLDPVGGGRRVRGRGRARSRQPCYGVARDFGTPASLLPNRFTPTVSAAAAAVAAAAAGRHRPAAAEQTSAAQQVVYVHPSAARPPAPPGTVSERLLVLPSRGGGGGGAGSRPVVVSRGRARTVTYVPTARPGAAAPRPAEHQYAADRFIRTAVYSRLNRSQPPAATAETPLIRPPPPPPAAE